MTRNAIVPTGTRVGVGDWITAAVATSVNAPVRTRVGCTRSDSQPPTGRITTATSTTPAILFDASAGVSGYAVFR